MATGVNWDVDGVEGATETSNRNCREGLDCGVRW